jgi:hypothetical protein
VFGVLLAWYLSERRPPVSCEITPVETADGIQIAIGNVLQALDNDKIDVKKAIAMLYGLQTANSNLKRTNPEKPAVSRQSSVVSKDRSRSLVASSSG